MPQSKSELTENVLVDFLRELCKTRRLKQHCKEELRLSLCILKPGKDWMVFLDTHCYLTPRFSFEVSLSLYITLFQFCKREE